VEVRAAFRIPESAPFFAVFALADGASASSVRIRLVAKSAIVTEFAGAVLPADGTNTVVTLTAERITKQTVLFFVGRA